MSRLLIIGGPTAAGKTAAAIQVACQWGAAIVSADAMMVYRGMDIGTAKPPPSVLRRYPHAAVDVRDPNQEWTVADFTATVEAVAAAHERVVVVGGTPFYLSALIQPLAKLPAADPGLRAQLEALDDLHGALAAVDPESAARLHPNDRVRLVRALEVYHLSGRPLSVHLAEDQAARAARGPSSVPVVWMDRDPAELDARIEARLVRMMERGYLDEVRRLLDAGYGRGLKPMKSLGYEHLSAHLAGELSLEEAVRRTGRDTRRLARKQRTWSRSMGWAPGTRADVLRAAGDLFGATCYKGRTR